jgi:hypothetical protein
MLLILIILKFQLHQSSHGYIFCEIKTRGVWLWKPFAPTEAMAIHSHHTFNDVAKTASQLERVWIRKVSLSSENSID